MSHLPPGEWWRLAGEVVWLPTAAEMARLDEHATSSGAIPERALIENAGREVARHVHGRRPEGPVVALVGSGHNGADALVALRSLAAWGRETRAVLCGSRPPEPDVLRGWELPLLPADRLDEALQGASVLLDGILGTGLAEAPRRAQAAVIERANGSGVPIMAVDGPSGADFSTGRVPGACIQAALTVSLAWPKLGLLRFPARRHCGDLVAVEIGFPPPSRPVGARAITARWVRRLLPSREPDAHKGAAGYLALVAGQPGMAGAAILAARAATRGGAGIVRVVSHPDNREIVQSAVPDAVFVGWEDREAVRSAISWSHAVAMGPGLGRGPERRGLVEEVLEARGERPLLLDADGLNAFAGEPELLAGRMDAPTLITPHPGELARLLDVPLDEIVEDPPSRAREAAATLGCVVLLKGAPSMVAGEGEPLRVSSLASPALAAGGTGDVLTGLAGAYLAGGAAPADAAAAGLLVSGLAASSAAAVGRVASDLPEDIPAARAAVASLPRPQLPGVLFASPAPPAG